MGNFENIVIESEALLIIGYKFQISSRTQFIVRAAYATKFRMRNVKDLNEFRGMRIRT